MALGMMAAVGTVVDAATNATVATGATVQWEWRANSKGLPADVSCTGGGGGKGGRNVCPGAGRVGGSRELPENRCAAGGALLQWPS